MTKSIRACGSIAVPIGFVVRTLEEGFCLDCAEAMASGCVPLVSEACTEVCRHEDNNRARVSELC